MNLSWPEDADVRRIVAQWGHLLDEALIADGGDVPDLDWPDDLVIAEALDLWGSFADGALDVAAAVDPIPADSNLAWLGELAQPSVVPPTATAASSQASPTGSSSLPTDLPLSVPLPGPAPVPVTVPAPVPMPLPAPVPVPVPVLLPVPARRPAPVGWTRKHKVARPGMPLITTGWSVRVPAVELSSAPSGAARHRRGAGHSGHARRSAVVPTGHSGHARRSALAPADLAAAQVAPAEPAQHLATGQISSPVGSVNPPGRFHQWGAAALVAAVAAGVLLAGNLLAKPRGAGQALRIGGDGQPASTASPRASGAGPVPVSNVSMPTLATSPRRGTGRSGGAAAPTGVVRGARNGASTGGAASATGAASTQGATPSSSVPSLSVSTVGPAPSTTIPGSPAASVCPTPPPGSTAVSVVPAATTTTTVPGQSPPPTPVSSKGHSNHPGTTNPGATTTVPLSSGHCAT